MSAEDRPDAPCDQNLARPFVIIAAVALAVRALYVTQASQAPLFDLPIMDGAAYREWATRIAAGDWIGSEVFYQAPLYPYFLALIQLVFGDSLASVRVVQTLLGSLSCGFLFLAARWFFSRRVGWIAGLGLALYPPAMFFDGQIQKASLGGVLVTALLALLARARFATAPRLWLAAGVTLGALMATREETLLLAPVVLGASWLLGRARAQATVNVLATLAGLALILGPIAARNAYVGGEFVLTTSQAGSNFYIGNQAGALGVYEPLLPGRSSTPLERIDARQLAEQGAGRTLSAAEVSSYWFGKSFEWISAHPVDWLVLLARKFALALNAYEIPDYEDQGYYAQHSWLLRGLGTVLHFGLIAPLAAAGIALSWHRRRELAVLLAVCGALLFGLVLFYVFGRYRYPLAPPALIFAAAAVVLAQERWLANDRRKLAPALLAALGLGVISNWPMIDRRAQLAMSLSNVGAALIDAGRGAEAVPDLKRSVELADDPDTRANLSAALLAANQPREALVHAEIANELRPDDPVLLRKLAAAQLQSGDEPAAIETLKRAIQRRPTEVESWEALVGVFVARGDWTRAIETARNAVRYNSDSIAAGLQLVWLLSVAADPAQRAPDEAVRLARELEARTRGEDVRVLEMHGVALSSAGRRDDGQLKFEQAARRAQALGLSDLADRIRATAAAIR